MLPLRYPHYAPEIWVFFVSFTRKNCKNEVKISNLANIRKNVIKNLELDIPIMS